ncbi:HlyD family efflux transporter periplasmic adaptor subunit [Undibacterium sp. 14-3-2]|nr:HlyD family efflux transporter periplasmic adaptor subunit [Undibacterium sp. 14-3-2]
MDSSCLPPSGQTLHYYRTKLGEQVTVSGQLLPDTGLIKLYSPQAGIVIKRFVKEGQAVFAGDILYIVSIDRESSTIGATQKSISNQVAKRQKSLQDEILSTRLLQKQDMVVRLNKMNGLKQELAKLNDLIVDQKNRVDFANTTLNRYTDLLKLNYISVEQQQQKQEELLDQKNKLQSLERDRITVERNLLEEQDNLAGNTFKQRNDLLQIERALASTDQELTESEAKRTIQITAPESGTVTAIVAEVGQSVETTRPMASIVPTNAIFVAELYAPSRSIGFVRHGDEVLIRYQAFPYQKFGHHVGRVESVSKTALLGSELNAVTTMANGDVTSSPTEPMYRVIVKLESQKILAYGSYQKLQTGMLLDADIRQETLYLYEWVLDPLYTLTGKI